jgi:calcineurin-like phosphoesterase family protein
MSKIWFTSDIHFGHRNILAYCPNRPFSTIEEHDAAIINEWRSKIAPADEVYFLGDLTLDSDPERCLALLEKLPGHVHVVTGNHDRALRKVRKLFGSPAYPLDPGTAQTEEQRRLVERYVDTLDRLDFMPRSDRVEGFYRFKRDGVSCVLNHHPIEDWPGRAEHGRKPTGIDPLSGRWHLHGHSHGTSRKVPARLDVGWDTANRILSWEEVQRIMRS